MEESAEQWGPVNTVNDQLTSEPGELGMLLSCVQAITFTASLSGRSCGGGTEFQDRTGSPLCDMMGGTILFSF